MDAISVTALNKYVKEILEKDAVLTDVAIRGEISNFVNHYKTGHFYFSLKDTACSVKAVMFRADAQRLAFMPESGMNVIVFCRVSLFERDGSFQIYVIEMLPDGIGAMQLAFEQLKQKLLAEGLFDDEHKKSVPAMPKKIAVVTSKTGAALQDIINVITRRYPIAELLLVPVTVQGAAAAPEIANGIKIADTLGADVMLVARGGGSKEDLWVFNDERIARAAYNANTPIVSAIGHEIDFCILDFAADLRAPTPSAAAELVTPDIYELFAKNTEIYTNIKRNMQNRLNLCYNKLNSIAKSHALVSTALAPSESFKLLLSKKERLVQLAHAQFDSKQRMLAYNAQLAESLSPFKVLSRGYAIVKKDARAYASVSHFSEQDKIDVVLKDGTLKCNVIKIEER